MSFYLLRVIISVLSTWYPMKFQIALTAISLLGIPSASAAVHSRPRPPQFVAIAFDGSYDLARWEDTRDFAKTLQSNGDFRYTYFVSATYFLENERRAEYVGPLHKPGQSDIGFGGKAADIAKRIEQVRFARHEGHEMGSHACGHFDGSRWSAANWAQDFASFGKLTSSFLDEGGQKEVVGFRAPYLGVSPGLFATLKTESFRYDTSRVAVPSYWPEKKDDVWNFPLASLKIAGTGKGTLSMDYNFYVAQSQAKPDAARSALYEQQMVETYLRYFEGNYRGNRAPVHIGHHFGLWNGAAYWRALKRFAKEVCAKPEVRCVTYRELADFMDGLDAPTLAAYRKGEFEKMDILKDDGGDLGREREELKLGRALELELRVAQSPEDGSVTVVAAGADAGLPGLELRWELNGRPLRPVDGRLRLPRGMTVGSRLSAVAARTGIELQRATHELLAEGRLSLDSLESRATLGDLPGAHAE